jgi:Dolichyl-phosphate-mannose-protein mannosyltransferase
MHDTVDLRRAKHVDKQNRNRLILLSLVLVGTILRFHDIASAWFGFDEAATLNLGQAHWFTFERIMWVREMNMVGYYALVRLWLNLNPDLSHSTLTFVRTLSALFSIATIPTLYALGKKLFNENVGLLAAGLLAINAFHIKHAQNARSYSLFVFLVTLATLLLVDNIKNPHPIRPRLAALRSASQTRSSGPLKKEKQIHERRQRTPKYIPPRTNGYARQPKNDMLPISLAAVVFPVFVVTTAPRLVRHLHHSGLSNLIRSIRVGNRNRSQY